METTNTRSNKTIKSSQTIRKTGANSVTMMHFPAIKGAKATNLSKHFHTTEYRTWSMCDQWCKAANSFKHFYESNKIK